MEGQRWIEPWWVRYGAAVVLVVIAYHGENLSYIWLMLLGAALLMYEVLAFVLIGFALYWVIGGLAAIPAGTLFLIWLAYEHGKSQPK